MAEHYHKDFRQYVDLLRKAPKDFDILKVSKTPIATSEVTVKVLKYFIEHGAASSWVLQVKLKLPEASVYRALKELRRYDIIVEAMKASKKGRARGGPRPTIWGLWDAHHRKVYAALQLHYKEYEKREPESRAQEYR
jgi:DNA-binding IclR family transcriptional regulator